MIIAILIIVWVVCGAFTYAITLGFFQREFPIIAKEYYRQDLAMAIFYGLLGPFGLFVAVLMSRLVEHGLKWK